jgi:NAD(P)-dependent dehydrogenase (short-subunit alcohol dehydrogenase family)
MNKKMIVMTGGSSGIGAFAIEKFRQIENAKVIVGVRNKKLINGVETLELDLTSLESVRKFAIEVIKRAGDEKITSLVLNAGTNMPSIESRTIDGFETTFAVNHLAHYLLIRLLLPIMTKDSVIAITTSGTHDPAEGTLVEPPKHADAKLLAYPENDKSLNLSPQKNASRSYSASKLCNILTVRYLLTLPEVKNKNITVIAYNPGPTPGTGLARNSPLVVRIIWWFLGLRFFQWILPHFNNRRNAGKILAEISLGKITAPLYKFYASIHKGLITWTMPSELAQNDHVMEELWKESAVLVGL